MNQIEAAELLGLSESTVSRYCSGERTPSLETMLLIRDRLRWSIESQADEVRCGTYHHAFAQLIEKRRARRRVVNTSTVWSVSGTGPRGDGVCTLDSGQTSGQTAGLDTGTS